jgi:hypothetical protein
LIQYYIDGSTKNNTIGVGIVKVNEYGFIEKHHYNVEHINPTSSIAEGYSLEKTFDLIKENDLNKNELIDIYTDCQQLQQSLLYNQNIEFHASNFYSKQESNSYFQHIRSIYIDLVARYAKSPLYYCEKTNQARPLIKIFFKDVVKEKKYLEEAHSLSRNYLKEESIPKKVETKPIKVELKAIKEKNKWLIVKDQDVISENSRPLMALADALKKIDPSFKHIRLCDTLVTFIKNTNKNNITNQQMKDAIKEIEKHKYIR